MMGIVLVKMSSLDMMGIVLDIDDGDSVSKDDGDSVRHR